MSLIIHLYNLLGVLFPANCHALRRTLLRWAGCSIGRNVAVNHSVTVYGNAITIGEETWISSGCSLVASYRRDEALEIGSRCDVGPGVLFVTGTHEIGTQERRAGTGLCLPIHIGDGTWIGAHTTVLGGACVGKGTVIAAGSVVLPGEYPDNCLLAGVPAVMRKILP